MTPEERRAIKERDAASADLWFTGPASFTAMSARDRRALLADNEALRKALQRIADYDVPDAHAMIALARDALSAREKTT